MRSHVGSCASALALGLVLVLAAAPAGAGTVSTGDGVWHWQNPWPQGNRLLAVDFVDASTGWAVGQSGTIIRTSDGGATWTGQVSGTTWDLTGVSFADTQHGWVIGEYEEVGRVLDYQGLRVMLRTVDGGATWKRVRLPGSEWPYLPKQVCFVDRQNGWVLGQSDGMHTLLRTEDGGRTWEHQTVDFWQRVTGIAFTSATRGYAVSWSKVYRTDDGGKTWQIMRDEWPAGKNTHWTSVDAVGEHVWVSNASRVYSFEPQMIASSDGGQTWAELASPPALYAPPTFVSAAHGWGLSRGAVQGIIATDDGGASWSTRYADMWGSDSWNVDPLGLDIEAVDALHVIAVGSFGTITRTSDGSTWSRPSGTVSTADLVDVSFPDALHGWAVGGYGAVVRTVDGGVTWTPVTVDGLTGATCVTFSDADHGWIGIGSPWSHDEGALLRTTDGGATWELVDTASAGLEGLGIEKLQFFDPLHGWALLDYAGTLARTDDGGKTWHMLDMETTGAGMRSAFDFAFADPQRGCLVGWPSYAIDGSIIGTTAYTDDGGETWHPDGIERPTSEGLMQRVAFGDSLHGWAVGNKGIWRTEDGGVTWQRLDLPAQSPPLPDVALTGPYLDVAGIDADSAVVVARNGVILRTEDSGVTWYHQASGRQREDLGFHDAPLLSAVCAVDGARLWAVGGRGAILSTYNGFVGADSTPPVTVVPDADGSWVGRAAVDLVAADDGAGVASTQARVDAGEWRHGSRIAVGDGVHELEFFSTDAAGNVEALKSAQVKVDLHPPQTELEARDTWTDRDVEVTLTAVDALSGVAATRWAYSGNQPNAGASFTVEALPAGANDGEHRIVYWSEDAAGNIEETQVATVRIDTWSPSTTCDDDGATISGPTSIDLSAVDPAPRANVTSSGVTSTYYSIDGGAYRPADAASPAKAPSGGSAGLTAAGALAFGEETLLTRALIDPLADQLSDGPHTVSFYSVDAAGNQEAPSTITIHVDGSVTRALDSVGRTATNLPKARWTTPAGWTPTRIEVSDQDLVGHDGAFVTTVAAADLAPAATSYVFSSLAPLRPGTYFLHVRFANESLGREQWTASAKLVIPRTATPKLVPPARLALKAVVAGSTHTLRVSYAVRVRDDSKGRMLLRIVQQRVVGGRVVASVTTTHRAPAPRAFGTRSHEYRFSWLRPKALRGKGTYRVVAQARDQEYNWSARLITSRRTTF